MHLRAHPGTWISINGTLQACAKHPTLYQRTLYTLTDLPGWLLWAGILLLLWRLVRIASRNGPFTAPAVLPVPLLTGSALLTFARIIRRGAAMDDEIRATV